MKVEKIIDAIKEATQAARDADPGEGLKHDGGTCNCDAIMIRLPRIRQCTIAKITRATGISFYKWDSYNAYSIGTPARGQADRRVKMQAAAFKVLKQHELDVFMHYAMD